MYLCVVILLLSLLSACSQIVRVENYANKLTPNTSRDNGILQGIATKVVIRPPAQSQQPKHSQSGLIVVGAINNWDIDANSSLPDAVHTLFLQHYADVEISKDCNGCGLIVHPEITHIDIQSVTMQATVGIELRIYDANFNLVTTLNSQGSSSFLSASRLSTGVAGYFVPFLGSAIGSMVVRGTVHSALEKALQEANTQLALEANGGVLARTWLPKTQLRKKEHCKHEYTAEQVAKNAGCDMKSDGISLTTQEYSKETYSAHCWGKASFNISCEYGRCSLVDPQEFVQNGLP